MDRIAVAIWRVGDWERERWQQQTKVKQSIPSMVQIEIENDWRKD